MKLSYYDLLSPNGDELRMNLPLSALGFSRETNQILFKHAKIIDGKVIPKFPLVKDLVAYGKTPLMGLITSSVSSYTQLDNTIQEIEEKLARLGLKFKDSEFSVGDVRVCSIDFCKDTKIILEKLKMKIQTLDDLSIFGAKKLSNYFPFYNKKYMVITDISSQLELYGLKFEGSDYRVDKKRFFNLDEFQAYLPQNETIKENTREANPGIFKLSNLHELSYDELLQTHIEILPLSPRIKNAFYTMGIETIHDIVKRHKNSFRHIITPTQITNVEDLLAKYNLQFKGSNYQIVDGKIIRTRSTRTTNKAPAYKDISKQPKEEQDKFLDTPILEFGLAPYLEKAFKEQKTYITIRDLVLSDKKQLSLTLGNDSVATSIEKLLSKYGLSMQKCEKQLKKTKYVDEMQIHNNNIPTQLTETKKQEYLSMQLETAGFTKTLIEIIHKAGFKAETIEDIVSHGRNEYFNSGLTNAQIKAIRNILSHYGHTVSSDEKYWRNRKHNQYENDQSLESKEYEYEQRKLEHAIRATEHLGTRETKNHNNLVEISRSQSSDN